MLLRSFFANITKKAKTILCLQSFLENTIRAADHGVSSPREVCVLGEYLHFKQQVRICPNSSLALEN
jgi:hypothetical protein